VVSHRAVRPERISIPEDHPQRPINPYGHSKLFVEQLLADLSCACGLPWVSLRYFNAAGADPSGEIGEAHDPETHLIPLVICVAQAGSAVQSFGADYDTPNGSCDYIHVSDIVDAHLPALQHLLQGRSSLALNLANQRGYPARKSLLPRRGSCGSTIRSANSQRRRGDPAALIGNSGRACALLCWNPECSELETQVADAWNWIRKHGEATKHKLACQAGLESTRGLVTGL
jgi:UDP-arabinose 4-epimerase